MKLWLSPLYIAAKCRTKLLNYQQGDNFFPSDIIHLILAFPTFYGSTCFLEVLCLCKHFILGQSIVSTNGILYLIYHSFTVRTIIITKSSGKNSLFVLLPAIRWTFPPTVYTVLEYALIHDTTQIILGFGSQVTLAVKTHSCIVWGNETSLAHPFQNICTIGIHKSGKWHFIIRSPKQQVGKRTHFGSHALQGVLGLMRSTPPLSVSCATYWPRRIALHRPHQPCSQGQDAP